MDETPKPATIPQADQAEATPGPRKIRDMQHYGVGVTGCAAIRMDSDGGFWIDPDAPILEYNTSGHQPLASNEYPVVIHKRDETYRVELSNKTVRAESGWKPSALKLDSEKFIRVRDDHVFETASPRIS